MPEPWQQAAWEGLTGRLRAGNLPHAILLHGPAGLGKRSLAEAFVSTLLCRTPREAGGACGRCRGCVMVRAGTHPDLHRVGLEDESRQLRIEQIRRLSERVALTSSEGGYQVFVIDPADRMNVNAANAFLKTLEEPRPGTLLLLLAESRSGLPVTILSRCQQIAIPLPAPDDALAWLAAEAPDAEVPLRKAALQAAGGSPGQALLLIRQDKVGLYESTLDDLRALREGQADPVAIATGWAESDPSLRLRWMSDALRRAAWQHAAADAAPAPSLTVDLDLASLTELATAADRARKRLETNLRGEQLIEALLGDWMSGRVDRGGWESW